MNAIPVYNSIEQRQNSAEIQCADIQCNDPKVVSLKLTTLTNEQLAALIGDIAETQNRQAFSQLFQYYAPRLKSFSLKQGTSPSKAEELVQETMLLVWRKSAGFDASRGSASNWIFTILRNKRIDMFRKERHPEIELEEGMDVAIDAPAADEAVGDIQRSEIIRTAIADLPSEQRQIIYQAFFEDKSHGEIALDLQLPLGTVKSRIRLGVAKLKHIVGDKL
jgi:RNA polymerase sigma-70 factor (ECF subfamily)